METFQFLTFKFQRKNEKKINKKNLLQNNFLIEKKKNRQATYKDYK